MLRCRLYLASASLVLFLATPGLAQNLVVSNPNFDSSDVSAWNVFPNLAIVQDPSDAFGNVSSGSAHVTNSAPTAYNAGPNYCLPGAITPGAMYDLGARVRIPTPQTAAGFASVAVYWYSGGCGAGFLGSTFTPSAPLTNVWTLSTSTNLTAPAGAVKAVVYLFVNKTDTSGTFEAYFDRVFLGPTGTTPVSLQGFEAE